MPPHAAVKPALQAWVRWFGVGHNADLAARRAELVVMPVVSAMYVPPSRCTLSTTAL
jgi:hypothetical protein